MRPDPLLTLGLTGPGDVPVHRAMRALAPKRRHVFEPLHPRLVEYRHVLEEHPEAWPEGMDQPDRRALQTAFLGRCDPAGMGFSPRFGRGGFFRSSLAGEPDLGAYLRRLADRDEQPVHLHLNRALGRTGLLADLFREARAIVFVRHPMDTWRAWQPNVRGPFDDRTTPAVHGLNRRLYELESQLPAEEFTAWGFEAARDHSSCARFLVTWGFLHRVALREARRFAALNVVKHERLLEDPESTLGRLAAEGTGADPNVPEALAALQGAAAPRRFDRERDAGRLEGFLEALPETSPLPDVLESLGYRP